MGPGTDLFDWETQRSRGGDMAEVDSFGLLCHSLPELVKKQVFIRPNRKGDGLADDVCPGLAADKIPGFITGAILMIARQDLVAGT